MNGEIVSRHPGSSIRVNNSDVLLSCGVAGLGMLHALYTALKPCLETGKLKEVLSGYATVTKPVSILYPDRRYLPPKVRVFIEWFTEIFRKNHQG